MMTGTQSHLWMTGRGKVVNKGNVSISMEYTLIYKTSTHKIEITFHLCLSHQEARGATVASCKATRGAGTRNARDASRYDPAICRQECQAQSIVRDAPA